MTLPTPSSQLITQDQPEAYDALRTPWNLAVDQRPAAVALPAGPDDVAEVLAASSRAGHRVAVQGGAHNPGPLGDLRDTVLIRTAAMSEVHVDPVTRTARVGAGALWQDVVPTAAEHSLYPMHGSSPNVGVVGYSLGGGLGWVARAHGLHTNRLTAIELVTAGGEPARVTADQEPDLFWALRGGGGGFGIVTALEFELLPITSAYAGWLAWDWRDSERVLRRWAAWAADAPEHVTTAARILQVPPLPEFPDPIRGRQLLVVDGAILPGASDGDGRAVIAPLRELTPEIDTFATIPAAALSTMHGDPEPPTPVVSDHALLDNLGDDGVTAFVEAAGAGSGSTLVSAELRQLGGALERPAPGGGALDAMPGRFLLYAGAVAVNDDLRQAGTADAHRLVAAMGPWSTGRRYTSFTENAAPASAFHDDQTLARLRRIRAAADPDGLLHGVHAVK